MTTSGSYNYSLNRNQLIDKAFALINVKDITGTADSSDLNLAIDTLNLMLKDWQKGGIKLWKRFQATLFPNSEQASYQLGSVSGADHCTKSYVSTTVSSGSGTSLTVISSTGMTISDNIGIELDDGTRQWTTITNIVSNVLTLNTSLTSATSEGNTVLTYTTKINRPIQVLRGTRLTLANLTETELGKLSYDDYFNQPIKTTPGDPNNFYYDRLITGSVPYTGTLYVFPTPSTVNTLVKFTYYDGFQDMDSSTDTLDFPQEWVLAVIYNLACELAYFYGKYAELERIEPKAMRLKEELSFFDGDDDYTSFSLYPNGGVY